MDDKNDEKRKPAAVAAPTPMAAPAIPNLLARLGSGPPRAGRGGRRGLGGRGGGRGGGGGYGTHGTARPPQDHNSVVQSTDTDAALARRSAVDLGLLQDPFAQFFAGDGGPAPRRLPIINRGTYTRTQALDAVICAFLAGPSRAATPSTPPAHAAAAPPPLRQVVSLGAGTDTRSLRLLARRPPGGPAFQNVLYHEIDFPAVSARKRSIVQSVPAIRSLLQPPPDGDGDGDGDGVRTTETGAYPSWHVDLGGGNQLWGHGLDLRQLAAGAGAGAGAEEGPSQPPLALAGLRADVPTLLVSECCLCYLAPAAAAGVLRYFSQRAADADLGLVVYEPIRPDDAFGRTMVANLAARGLALPTLAAYPDGAAQEARLRHEARLARAAHRTIDDIWRAWVPADEQERVNRLDGLDEVEEWALLASHYVVAWGSRGPYFDEAWASLYAGDVVLG